MKCKKINVKVLTSEAVFNQYISNSDTGRDPIHDPRCTVFVTVERGQGDDASRIVTSGSHPPNLRFSDAAKVAMEEQFKGYLWQSILTGDFSDESQIREKLRFMVELLSQPESWDEIESP
jgi:hypothetical protein